MTVVRFHRHLAGALRRHRLALREPATRARPNRGWRPCRRRLPRNLAIAVCALVAIAATGLVETATNWSAWELSEIARHLAAAPNCDAARAVGLAPARRGEPGYYDRHDRDKDGIACEVWRDR